MTPQTAYSNPLRRHLRHRDAVTCTLRRTRRVDGKIDASNSTKRVIASDPGICTDHLAARGAMLPMAMTARTSGPAPQRRADAVHRILSRPTKDAADLLPNGSAT